MIMDECKNSLNQIRLADKRDQTAVVVELCKKHLRKFPKHGPAWLWYAMSQTTFARYAEAEKAIRRAILLCPKNKLSRPYTQMGHLLEAKGDFKEAMRWYRKAARLDPQDAGSHIYLGSNAFKQGFHKQEEAHYRRALKCSTGCLEEIYFNLGGIFLGKRNYSEAIKYYQEALKIDPKYKIAKERLDDAQLALLIANS
jgi:tetratricopeptide (TPR) repeat protein